MTNSNGFVATWLQPLPRPDVRTQSRGSRSQRVGRSIDAFWWRSELFWDYVSRVGALRTESEPAGDPVDGIHRQARQQRPRIEHPLLAFGFGPLCFQRQRGETAGHADSVGLAI